MLPLIPPLWPTILETLKRANNLYRLRARHTHTVLPFSKSWLRAWERASITLYLHGKVHEKSLRSYCHTRLTIQSSHYSALAPIARPTVAMAYIPLSVSTLCLYNTFTQFTSQVRPCTSRAQASAFYSFGFVGRCVYETWSFIKKRFHHDDALISMFDPRSSSAVFGGSDHVSFSSLFATMRCHPGF